MNALPICVSPCIQTFKFHIEDHIVFVEWEVEGCLGVVVRGCSLCDNGGGRCCTEHDDVCLLGGRESVYVRGRCHSCEGWSV